MEAKPRMLKKPEGQVAGLENKKMDISKPSEGTTNDIPSKKGINPLIDESCITYLNYRIQQEEYSARIYLSMSMWLNNEGYMGAAALWKKYSDEEMTHADIARKYMLSFGVQPVTPRLDQPKQTFSGLPEIIKLSFEHEIEVSKQIKEMANHALADGSHMLYELSLTYLKEQVEEHDKMQTWVDKLEAFGTDKLALRLLDNEMAG
jgi:ferritin